MPNNFDLEHGASEYAGAALGDARRSERLERIGAGVLANPAATFPKMFRTEAETEALYRFLQNPSIEPQAILGPHIEATLARCEQFDEVLVASDTSEISFSTPREGLGRLQESRTGFLAHVSLALGFGRFVAPVGVLDLRTVHRFGPPKRSRAEQRRNPNPESQRWLANVEQVECLAAGLGKKVVHLQDREGDFFDQLAVMTKHQLRFVIRQRVDRNCVGPLEAQVKSSELLASLPSELLRDVTLSERLPWKRSKTAKTHHAPRAARMATLHVRGARMTLLRPEHNHGDQATASVNVVHVFEPRPPEGEAAIEWVLMTSEPMETAEQCARVVDMYRARWLIEEFFKALKTGCAYEERQLENPHSVVNALAVLVPTAWHLLALRWAARTQADAPATSLLSPLQLKILIALSVRVRLRPDPTVREALLAIAGLGGHLKQNGEPGWQTLQKGMGDLVAGITAVKAMAAM